MSLFKGSVPLFIYFFPLAFFMWHYPWHFLVITYSGLPYFLKKQFMWWICKRWKDKLRLIRPFQCQAKKDQQRISIYFQEIISKDLCNVLQKFILEVQNNFYQGKVFTFIIFLHAQFFRWKGILLQMYGFEKFS